MKKIKKEGMDRQTGGCVCGYDDIRMDGKTDGFREWEKRRKRT